MVTLVPGDREGVWSHWCQEIRRVCGHSDARENPEVPKCLHGRRSVTTFLKVFFHSHLFGSRACLGHGPCVQTTGHFQELVLSLPPCAGPRAQTQVHRLGGKYVYLPIHSYPTPIPCPRKLSFVPLTVANNYIEIRNGLFLCSCSKKENRIL